MTSPRSASTQRRALLVGAPVGGLQGVQDDVAAMREELERWRFECIELVGPEATRAAILCALRDLVTWATAHDAVVIYFSGHGGQCRLVEKEGDLPGPPWNFLVPTDIDAHGDFRGIAEFELAGLLDDLSMKTTNVTVILDCCHSATMARDWEMTRALPERRIMPTELQESVARLARRPRALDPDGHPDVVRVVATAQGSSAFEGRHDGRSGGYLTVELCAALAEARRVPLTWEAIIGQVRERITERRGSTTQRPEVEGPRTRLPFSLHQPACDGERNAFVRGPNGTAWLRGGRLHGLSRGDQVLIPGAPPVTGRIVEVLDDAARLELGDGSTVPPSGRMTTLGEPTLRRRVHLTPSARGVGGLLSSLQSLGRLAVVDDEHAAELGVTLGAAGLELCGPAGVRRNPRPATAATVAELAADLDGLARTQILLDALRSPPGLTQGQPSIAWKAEVFVVEPGHDEPRSLRPGEILPEGVRIYVELRHLSRGMPVLYVNVLERGISGRLQLINRSEPAGVQLRPLETRWVGRRRYGDSKGLRLTWPDLVPRSEPGPEELIFVASRRPLDLRSLLEGPERHPAGAHRSATPAEELDTPLSWAVERVAFVVAPAEPR